MARYDFHVRLEPTARQRDLSAGFAASIHDPVWFLARQWQMGEHQGENAASPVLVRHETIHTPLQPNIAVPGTDPSSTPPEAIVEAEPHDWWTIGRRVRLGAALATRAGLSLATASADLLLVPPPPYDRLPRCFDGLALWQHRAVLDPGGTRFANLGIPEPQPSFWDTVELVYTTEFPLNSTPGARTLELPRHRGGRVDWHSADSPPEQGAAAFVPAGESVATDVYPTAFHYPGAPAGRWWEIEDAAVDIGGYPPDSSHFATTLLIDLIASHGDDWFVFPVDARLGSVLTLKKVTVTDGFGRSYAVNPPADWFLFRTSGLDPHSLVLWLQAMTPLQGRPLESVLLGVDEYANLLWAVERRANGRELAAPERTAAQEAGNPVRSPPSRSGGDEEVKRYAYVPGRDALPYWHPYEIEERVDAAGRRRRRFVQRRLADLSREAPELLPAASAAVLRVGEGSTESVHEIEPATVPSIGIELERRYALARAVDGKPVLWLQRERKPFLAPPARTMHYDLMVDDGVR